MWKIRPTLDVLGPKGTGTRRRSVGAESSRRTLEFGKEPIYLDILPPEIEEDSYLEKTEVTQKEITAAGGQVVRLSKPVQTSAPSPATTPGPKTDDSARHELLRRVQEQAPTTSAAAEQSTPQVPATVPEQSTPQVPSAVPEQTTPANPPTKPVQLVSPKAGPNRKGGRKGKK